jgi:hypothetical protein
MSKRLYSVKLLRPGVAYRNDLSPIEIPINLRGSPETFETARKWIRLLFPREQTTPPYSEKTRLLSANRVFSCVNSLE